MKSIFISYRRDDGITSAKLLKSILEDELGKDTVFLDTTTMGPGVKWRKELKDAVVNSKVVIAFIGPYWKGEKYWETKNKEDNRLLFKDDWVRLELETALQDSNKKIIPMIFFPNKLKGFDDSNHFLKETLPSSLQSIGDNNKAIIHEIQFEFDLKRTIIEISPFIKSEDFLSELPLPDYDTNNPLDHFPEYPFKGLDYYTEKDSRIFFGRDEQIKELYYKLSGNPLVLFYGQAGVGKSSLLFAGLKRRMESKGWVIEYWRRESTSNLAEKINLFVERSSNKKKQLLILDQIEEIYTNPSKVLSQKNEKFQFFESIEKVLNKNIHILLSFREEQLAKIQDNLNEKGLIYVNMQLQHIQIRGVLEAIEGIMKANDTKYIYNLFFEEKKNIPQKIAYLVLNDNKSHVAPMLQLLLRKLWDSVPFIDNRRVITEKLFDGIKNQSLKEMLIDQISSLRENFDNEIESGLVLDLLYFFTTSQGTSAAHTRKEVVDYFANPKILALMESLKNKYLLTDHQSDNMMLTRLAHDTLAPLIHEMYFLSPYPGQRAAILLESKKKVINENPNAVEYSKSDIVEIEAGKYGMRNWTENEKFVIKKNKDRIVKEQLVLEEAKEHRLQSRAKTLAAISRENLKLDSTIALRLAEAACKTTSLPTKEAQSAIIEILKQKFLFYKNNLKHTECVTSITFSPDGKSILTGSIDKTAKLWNLDGLLIQSFEGHTDIITSVAFSPDGKFILTGSFDKTAKLWNLDGTIKISFEEHNDGITSVAFSPNGKSILTGSLDKTAKLWNFDGSLRQSFEGHKKGVTSVAFSPDGKFILTGSKDRAVKLWSLDGTSMISFIKHRRDVTSVAFSPDGKFFLTGSEDKKAKLWNLDGNHIRTFKKNSDIVTAVTFSPDGKFILTGSIDNTAKLWGMDGSLLLTIYEHTSIVTSVAFSPGGKLILTGSKDGTAKVWTQDETLRQSFQRNQDTIYSVAFSHDGKTILTGIRKRAPKLWNLDGTLKQYFEGHTEKVTSVAFSPDGKSILTGSFDKTAKLWNLDGTMNRSFEEHNDGITSVAFSPNGKSILTGSLDKTAKLWNLDGTMNRSFEEHNDGITSVAFSPDGKFILTGSIDKTAKLWNLDGTMNRSFEEHNDGITSVAFSPDGKSILTGSFDKTAKLWNLDGTMKRSFEEHNDGITSVAFSPDGKFILTGSIDKTAKLCNLDGFLRQSFEGHTDIVTSVAFSPDGKSILTVSFDKTTKLWRTFWEILNIENTYVPTLEQIKEFGILEDIEWGKFW